jgi:ABC-type lipopolysaccharide export system ATPase subunit
VLAVLAVLAFCGWALLAAAAVAVVAVVAAQLGPGRRRYPNGAGQTTTMRLILGLDNPSAGSGRLRRTVRPPSAGAAAGPSYLSARHCR